MRKFCFVLSRIWTKDSPKAVSMKHVQILDNTSGRWYIFFLYNFSRWFAWLDILVTKVVQLSIVRRHVIRNHAIQFSSMGNGVNETTSSRLCWWGNRWCCPNGDIDIRSTIMQKEYQWLRCQIDSDKPYHMWNMLLYFNNVQTGCGHLHNKPSGTIKLHACWPSSK